MCSISPDCLANKKRVSLSVTVSVTTQLTVQECSRNLNISQSQFVSDAIEHYVNSKEFEKLLELPEKGEEKP